MFTLSSILFAFFVCTTSADTRFAKPFQAVEVVDLVESDKPIVKALDLAAAIHIAEINSPNLHEAFQEIEAARGRAKQSGLLTNPEFQSGANQLGGSDSQYFAQLSQEIVTKGKLKLDRAAACQEVRQAELKFVKTRFDLLTAVRQNFYVALAAQRRIEVLDKMAAVARKSSDTGDKLRRAGMGSAADVVLLEIELERANVGTENARTQMTAAKKQLAAVLGTPGVEIAAVQGDLFGNIPSVATHGNREGMLAANSQVQGAEVDIERNRLLLRRAQVQPFPNVTVQAGYMRQLNDPHNLAILQFGLPIPVWNRNEGNIRAARANIEKSVATLGRTENELSALLAATVGKLEAAQQQVERYRNSILPKAQKSVELTQRSFDVGQFDFLRVLQAQKALVETELSYVAALESQWYAAADLANLMQLEQFP